MRAVDFLGDLRGPLMHTPCHLAIERLVLEGMSIDRLRVVVQFEATVREKRGNGSKIWLAFRGQFHNFLGPVQTVGPASGAFRTIP